MSFGLKISFGRLCRKERTLDDVYLEARRITWEPSFMIPFIGIWGRNLRFISFDCMKGKLIDQAFTAE